MDSSVIEKSIEKKIQAQKDKHKRSDKQLNMRTWCKTGSTSGFQSEDGCSNQSVRISLKLVENPTHQFQFNQIVKNYHTYKPYTDLVGKRVNYIITNRGEGIGAIGFSNAIIAMKPRDTFIGWVGEEQRLANLHKVINNWRYCVFETGYSSQILSLALRQVQKDWQKRYNEKPVLVETLIEPPYKGTCYLASGFIKLGETSGTNFVSISKEEYEYCKNNKLSAVKRTSKKDGSCIYLRTLKEGSIKKIILVKPLHRYWKKKLQKDFKKENEKSFCV